MKDDTLKNPPPPALPAGEPSPKLRLYTKPTFRCEPVFETMALACGKTNPNQVNCKTGRNTS